ncbi:hypothetical protein CHFL109739_17460 [Chryseobacterium flavum]
MLLVVMVYLILYDRMVISLFKYTNKTLSSV